MGADLLGLGQVGRPLGGVGGGVVDILLALGHVGYVFLQGDQLVPIGGVVQQQIRQQLPLHAVVGHDAVFELGAEGLEKGLVFLPVTVHDPGKLGLDLLFQAGGDDLQLPVVLEHLPGDVQAQIRGVHHAPDEPEAVGQQIAALVHDHHAVGVEPQPGDVIPGIEIIGGPGGDEQQAAVAHSAFGVDPDHGHGVFRIPEGLFVEFYAVLVGGLLAAPLPQRHHGVDDLLRPGLPPGDLGDAVFVGLAGLHLLGGLHHGVNGPADVVGVFFHQLLDLPGGEIVAVALLVGVVLQLQYHVGAYAFLLAWGDGVAVGALALPAVGALLAVGPGDHRDALGHHERGIKAHAELTDHIDIGVLPLLIVHALLEGQGAGLGNDAQVVFQLLSGHAHAVVGHGEGALIFVGEDPDAEVAPGHAHLVIRQGQEAQLVDGVGGVGDELPEKDLLMGVDGVDHHVQQPPGFRLKLFLRHFYYILRKGFK